MANFESFNLKKTLMDSLAAMGFKNPTDVQERAIPAILEGVDVVVQAKTGTGKTGAFLIPIAQVLEQKDPTSAIVIVPTRELAIQVYNVMKKLSFDWGLRGALVYGGASINTQIEYLRRNPQIIIGTPGRIIDLMQRNEIDLSTIRYLVLDEADMMLDLGFIDDIEYIIRKAPPEKQVLLFSATIPPKISGLAQRYMKRARAINVSSDEDLTVETISHSYAVSSGSKKMATLLSYIEEYQPRKAIVFSDTKREADFIFRMLTRFGYDTVAIHGDLRQAQRERSLSAFRSNARFMVATNVAARGLDIRGISHIINYDTPLDPYVYVHRTGRSARMGADGSAFSIIIPEEEYIIREIENKVSIRMRPVYLSEEKFESKIEGFMRSGGEERQRRHSNSGYHNDGRGRFNRGPHSQRRNSGGGKIPQYSRR